MVRATCRSERRQSAFLQFRQPGVEAAGLAQLAMVALLHQLAPAQHQDAIGGLYARLAELQERGLAAL
jgi:hypothetical protein